MAFEFSGWCGRTFDFSAAGTARIPAVTPPGNLLLGCHLDGKGGMCGTRHRSPPSAKTQPGGEWGPLGT